MKSLSSILGGVGVFTLCVVACNDKDISLIVGDGGAGGSNTANGGSAGSTSTAGQGGSNNGGNAGTSGGGGTGGALGGSAGQSSAGTTGLEDPDGGTDSGPPPGPYAEICESYCASRVAWATGTTDGGVNCAGYDGSTCQASCEGEIAQFVADFSCPAAPAAYQCHANANAWYCQDNGVFNSNCVANFGALQDCSTTCDTEAAAVNTCLGL